jgi:hypothetical protein
MNLNSEGMSLGPNERTLKERLMSKVVVRDCDCWEFIGSRDNDGYGKIWSGGSRYVGARQIGAHVASYLVHVGPIRAGLYILHSCSLHGAPQDRPWCVNPKHLRAGTHKQNRAANLQAADCYQEGGTGPC